jgi:hypothetical protein
MPRRTGRKCNRRTVGASLDENLRAALLTGMELIPSPTIPTTRAEWLWAWNTFGAPLLPEFVAKWPGTRPDGMRLAGIIPPRELLRPLPSPNGFWVKAVTDERGRVVEHVCGVCQHCQCEAEQLLALGIIDQAEHDAHFTTGAHEYHCTGLPAEALNLSSRGSENPNDVGVSSSVSPEGSQT